MTPQEPSAPTSKASPLCEKTIRVDVERWPLQQKDSPFDVNRQAPLRERTFPLHAIRQIVE